MMKIRHAPYCVRVAFWIIEQADNGDRFETPYQCYNDAEVTVWRGDSLEIALEIRKRYSVLPEVESAEVLQWREGRDGMAGEWWGTTTPKEPGR